MTTFSVVVPAHQAQATLQPCLEAIVRAGFDPGEIIVVNDGSRDRTGEIARSFGVRVVTNQFPLRPAGARNRGVDAADGEVVLFIDADVVLQDLIRPRLVQHFSDAAITAVIGSYDDRADGGSTLSDYRNLLHHHVHQKSGGISPTFWTGIGAVRREAFVAAGGLKSEWENIEDVEFGLRLSAVDGYILLDPTIQGTHLKVWTANSMFMTDLFGRAIPWSRLIQSGRTRFGPLNTTVRHQAAAAGVAIMFAGALASLAAPVMALAMLAGLALFLLAASDVLVTLRRKRGLWFAVRAIPWHMLHYSAALLGFARVRLERFWDRLIGNGPEKRSPQA